MSDISLYLKNEEIGCIKLIKEFGDKSDPLVRRWHRSLPHMLLKSGGKERLQSNIFAV
jgi:hypothetical protein